MRKATTLILTGVLLAGLSGCANEPQNREPGPRQQTEVTRNAATPAAKTLERGDLSKTDRYWSIINYSTGGQDALRYLVSPGGQLTELPGEPRLAQWLPGTPYALRENGDSYQVINLETGEEVLNPDMETFARESGEESALLDVQFIGDGTTDLLLSYISETSGRLERINLEGQTVASTDILWDSMILSPDGNLISISEKSQDSYIILDAKTLQKTRGIEGQVCADQAWINSENLLVNCQASPQEGDASEKWEIYGAEPLKLRYAEPSQLQVLGYNEDGAIVKITPENGEDVTYQEIGKGGGPGQNIEFILDPFENTLKVNGYLILGAARAEDGEDEYSTLPLELYNYSTAQRITVIDSEDLELAPGEKVRITKVEDIPRSGPVGVLLYENGLHLYTD